VAVVRRIVIASVFGFAALSLLAPASQASRKATRAEAKAIVRALPKPAYPKSYYVYKVRISTVSKRWAAVRILPASGYESFIQPDIASVVRRKGHWKTKQVGNGGGCGVPPAVVADLKLSCS
jgi:curli biogenesis system outer membrane secretion channel CsgG